MPGTLSFFKNLAINALTIIPNSHAKQPLPIRNLRFDILRLTMLEGISQRLSNNVINIISKDRIKRLRCAFLNNRKLRRNPSYPGCPKFIPKRGDRMSKIVIDQRRPSYVIDRVASFHHRLIRALQSGVETLPSPRRIFGKHIPGRLKMKNQSLEALQQRVV